MMVLPQNPTPDSANPTRIGILGGGQLARMLAEAAIDRGLVPVVLVASTEDPAAIPAAEWILGSLTEDRALRELFERANVVVLENEFLDLELLGTVLADFPDVQFCPGLEGVATAQDKLAQKKLFERLAIPTADYEVVTVATLSRDLEGLLARFPEGFVLKWSRFGYDGRGNLVISKGSTPTVSAIRDFCEAGEEAGAEIYAERKIDFDRELAMVSTRTLDGEQVFFPLVASYQDNSVCREVFAPASAFGVSQDLEVEAQRCMREVAAALNMTGTFALEFFLTRDGELMTNEMAPRVHNTGHYTLVEGITSQFDLHVAAAAGLEVKAPRLQGVAVMRNLLGPADSAEKVPCAKPCIELTAGMDLYWYDKKVVSAWRKMGHLTARADSPGAAHLVLADMRAWEKAAWEQHSQDNDQSSRSDHHGLRFRSAGDEGSSRSPS